MKEHMRFNRIFAVCALSLALGVSTGQPSAAQEAGPVNQDALRLYNNGLYSQAMELFRQDSGNPLSYDYAVLCAVKLGLRESGALVAAADSLHSRTIINSDIHHEWGLRLFDAADYKGAIEHLSKVDIYKLPVFRKAELYYKLGLAYHRTGSDQQALIYLKKADKCNSSAINAANRFTIGVIEYSSAHFEQAMDWFALSAEDPRFSLLSRFYIVDCRFMLKDYDYVVREGERLFPELEEDRARYMSRIISESFLVLGDASKAQEYLEKENIDIASMSNEDLFHAASVLYTIGDYRGALPYFREMSLQSDSLSQVAAYEKAYSCVQVKNKVEAMNAFRFAAALHFDESIREDAFFNYAKLAFDLNSDSRPFKDYLSIFGTASKGEMVYNYIALCALQEKNYAGAVEAYDNVDELTGVHVYNYVKANFLRAQQLIGAGSYKAAVPYIKASAYYLPKTDPFNQFARYHLAETYYHSGMQQEALQVYTELYNTSALNGKPEGKLIPYNMAYCYFASKKYQQASRWFETYIKSSDYAARRDALLRRADCDFLLRDFKGAAVSYQKVLTEFPAQNDIYPMYQLALAHGLNGNMDKKISVLSGISTNMVSKPFYQEAMYELGRAYVETGRNKEAVGAFDRLLACAKDSIQVSKALVGVGLAYKNAGEYEKSLRAYRRVVGMKPRNEYFSDALLSIQSVYQQQGHPEKYLEYLEKNHLADNQTPQQKEMLYFSTAEQVFLAGNYSGAIQSAQRYISLYPQGTHLSDAYYYIAESYKHTGDREQALEYYIRSREQSSEGSYAKLCLLNMAALNYALEHYENAYDAYKDLSDYEGMMRSAFAAHFHQDAIDAAQVVMKRRNLSEDALRECQYILAKSYLSISRREEAFSLLTELCKSPATAEGAEAYYLIIKSRFDWGKFDDVESGVYDFAANAGDQSYWLAKAYIVLGDAFLERGNAAQALVTYESIRDGYEPAGPSDDVMDTVLEKINNLKSE